MNCSLPVEFLSFEGDWRATFPNLSWRVKEEVNVKNYILSRKTNLSSQYQTIAEVNATQSSLYSFEDKTNIEAGVKWISYSLQAVDLDGEISKTQSLTLLAGEKNEISLYPNPAQNTLQILALGEQNETLSYVVYSILGQEVLKGMLSKEAFIDVSSLQSGFYHVELCTSSGTCKKLAWVKE